MITLSFDEVSQEPLYEQLYRHIRQKIEEGKLSAGERLPSKRKMADHLRVSLRTVENAYAQLMVEGYVEAKQKKAYYVRSIAQVQVSFVPSKNHNGIPPLTAPTESAFVFDLRTNKVSSEDFPFSTWSKLMRENLRNRGKSWLEPSHPQGNGELRQAIVHYLRQFRNMDVCAEQVIIGAGSEYLLGLLTELLPDKCFALENPTYHKPARILSSRNVPFDSIAMDSEGISISSLRETPASVVLTAPSHHFPLGTVMSVNRRRQLLQWASESEDRFLIEDDYDSEFRYALRPVPSLHSLDPAGKVIYMNTFTRTLAPSLRIAYVILPPILLRQYQERLMFYACTVSEFEQASLKEFIGGGYYERHLNRVRTAHKIRRDALLKGLKPLEGIVDVHGQEAGLHLLVTATNGLTEDQLINRARNVGIGVYGLSDYFLSPFGEAHTVLLGYGGYSPSQLEYAASLLVQAWSDYEEK